MGSKGRIPIHHMRHPPHGPGLMPPEPFGAGIRPPHDGFPPRDMLPPPEILEQKLATQHIEMERLAVENQRLAATHGSLRQQLGAAQDELKMLDSQVQGSKVEREQQVRGVMERIAKMEAELQAVDRLKHDLQQARKEAQSLVEVRQELMAKVQQLNNDVQRAHLDRQQIPTMMSELSHLRQEFHQYKTTFEQERKIYHDHLESLRAMDKEYRSMADEVAKLRAELNNPASVDKRPAYGGGAGYGETDASAHNPSVQSSYEDTYGVSQAHHMYPASAAPATVPAPASAPAPVPAQALAPAPAPAPTPAAAGGNLVTSSGGTPTYPGPQSGPAKARVGFDASRNPPYEVQRGPAYDPQGGQYYNAQRASGYDAYRGVYNNMQRPAPYDPQRAAYDFPRGNSYDPHFRAAAAAPPPQGQAPVNNMPYGSAVPPSAVQTSAGHETQPRGGGNIARR